jgi:hypothetical protein
MAKPDTDDGWLRYAHELDAALAVADFTKGERIVLREVFSQTFGPAKRQWVELSPTNIATRLGCDKGYIGKAIASLASAGVLERSAKAHRFVKNYETWTRGDALMLRPSEVVYCRNAVRQAMAFKDSPTASIDPISVVQPDNGVVQRDNDVVQRDNDVVQPDNASVVQPDNVLLFNETTASPRAIEDRVRNSRPQEELASRQDSVATESKTPEADSIPKRIAAFIGQKTSDDDESNLEYFEAEIGRWVAAGHNEPTIRAALLKAFEVVSSGHAAIGWATKRLNDPKNAVVKAEPPKIHQPKPEPVKTPEEIAENIRWMQRWYDNQLRLTRANEDRLGLPRGTYSDHVQKPSILRSLESAAS